MSHFNGVELMIPDTINVVVAGDACPSGMGSWNCSNFVYFSRRFPTPLLDPSVPIHIKEFICLITAVKVWGQDWTGKCCQLYCDNDAVCDVVFYQKPKDRQMQVYLREFLFYVRKYNFKPIVSKLILKIILWQILYPGITIGWMLRNSFHLRVFLI